jgi:hypothetical protein
VITFKQFFTEQVATGKLVVVFPGRFQPFHKGHAAVYKSLQNEFPAADVFIATSGKVDEKSPFSFDERKQIIEFFGIPGDKIINVINPYKSEEITSKYNSETDHLVFALSEKDAERINFNPKKDGSPAYFIKLNETDTSSMQPFSQHGYIKIASVTPFNVLGRTVSSASEIRQLYKGGNEEQRKQIIIDLYGKFDDSIYNLFNLKLL